MNLWVKIAVVAAGGALGALSRTGLTELCTAWLGEDFPYGTMSANLLGCLFIGMARAGVETMGWWDMSVRNFVFAGFLGAFTTFSTFEADTVTLWGAGEKWLALLYMGGSVVAGLLAFTLGWEIVARFSV
jgi:CrcB protein